MSRRPGARALQTTGVMTFVVLGVRKAIRPDDPWLPSTLGALVIVGAVIAVVWLWSRRADRTGRGANAARPGWRTHAVWADETLGDTLARLGSTADKVRGGTRLTLAWSGTSLEIARGSTVAARVPWPQVWTITRTEGYAASTGNPAVEIVTRGHARFIVVPARRPEGGMLPASATQVDSLVAELRSAREGASAPSGPPPLH